MFLIPLLLNMAGVWRCSIILTLASVAAIPAVVALLPDARRHENMFTYFLTTISMIPTNIKLMRAIRETGLLEDFSGGSTVCLIILLYWIIFNCEQIALAFVTRAIWPRQYRLFHIKEDSDE